MSVHVSKRHLERTLKVLQFELTQLEGGFFNIPRVGELRGEIKALKDVLAGHYAHVEGQ